MKYRLIIICCFFTSVRCFPRVKTKNGELIGTTHTLPNGRVVYAFLGVPFAAPPIGRFRFEEPRPVKPWFGSRYANKPSKFCVQFFLVSKFIELMGEEDCLYLNVYTPRLPKYNEKNSKLMNVLLYIHGGAFSAGSGASIMPNYISQDEDIVFVSCNYRLGPFGFFSTGDKTTPGNNGIKDIIECLRWVKKNIRSFGGDPAKVTVYGHSSGAAIVHYLLLSPLSKGLFHNAVVASGAVLAEWALPQKTRIENSFILASSINCPTRNTRLMMMCLKHKPVERLYEASSQFFVIEKFITQIPFGPVLEKIAGGVIPEHPYDSLKNGHVHNVPLIVGVVEQEGSPLAIDILYNETKLNELNDKWLRNAPGVLFYDQVNFPQRDRISSSVRQYYFADKAISHETANALFAVFGDRLTNNGLMKSIKLHRSAISENIFCYKFYYRGTGSHCDYHSNPVKKNYGVCHGDDQFYLFSFGNRTQNNDNVKSNTDLEMVKLSTTTLIAFMKTGNPNTKEVKWKPLAEDGVMNCLNIYSYSDQRMMNIENNDVTKFWDDILPPEY